MFQSRKLAAGFPTLQNPWRLLFQGVIILHVYYTYVGSFSLLFQTLQWRHGECDSVPNQRCLDRLLIRLFMMITNEDIKTPRRWPLCGESTVDSWIPLTKGQ